MRQGTIGALGVSNFSAWQIGEIDHVADQLGMPRPVIAQQIYNLLARRIEEEYLEFAHTTGLRTMVYNPLGGGLLTGKYDFAEVPSTGRFGESRLASVYQNRYWDPRLFEAIAALTAIADRAGMTLIEVSLRWLMSSAGVDAVLIGASRAEQLRANVRAASQGALPADVLAACDDVARELRGPMPAYNR
jgi:aryl-alcohol dehydrogenase-like predicted oxidoreductase